MTAKVVVVAEDFESCHYSVVEGQIGMKTKMTTPESSGEVVGFHDGARDVGLGGEHTLR